jgi:hypothetical protein
MSRKLEAGSWKLGAGSWFCATALTLGLAVRVIALPLPGTTDLPIFELWADTASSEGVGRIYGTGGVFPERRLLERGGVRTKVNYPPLVLYEFIAAQTLHLPLKALTVIADLLIVLVLWLGVRARAPADHTAPGTALAYWLNPAAILTGSVLGYVEPLMAAPATAAVVAAGSSRAGLAGMLVAAAACTKPLALISMPATLLALIAAPGPLSRAVRVARLAGGASLVTLILIAPVLWNDGALNMAWSLAAPLRDPFLSGNAANLWWLVGLVFPQAPLDACRAFGALLTVSAGAWAITAARPRADLRLSAAAGAFSIHAYHVLAVSVHEAHLFPAVPLLALAAAGHPRLWSPFAIVSAIAVLNLDLFYGLGVGTTHLVPRSIAGVESATLLAVGNCLALVWHAMVFAGECRAQAAPSA